VTTNTHPALATPDPSDHSDTQRPEDEGAPSAICIGEQTRRDLNQAHEETRG
jgi:hypothetical protein